MSTDSDVLDQLIASALEQHRWRDHYIELPGIITSVDATNRLCSLTLKDDTVPTVNVPYEVGLRLAVGDTVMARVQGGRSVRVITKVQQVGAPPPSTGPFGFLIGSQTLAAAAATITFSNIPKEFKHLMLVGVLRGDVGVGNTSLGMRFNADAGANYYSERSVQNGAAGAIGPGEFLAQTAMALGYYAANTATAGLFSTQIIYVPYYGSAARKTVTSQGDGSIGKLTGNQYVWFASGWWDSVAAINSVTLTNFGGGNFVTGSIMSLYGLT